MQNFLYEMLDYAMDLLVSKEKYWTEVEPGVWQENSNGDRLTIRYEPNKQVSSDYVEFTKPPTVFRAKRLPRKHG